MPRSASPRKQEKRELQRGFQAQNAAEAAPMARLLIWGHGLCAERNTYG
jgi:hypothetical protein